MSKRKRMDDQTVDSVLDAATRVDTHRRADTDENSPPGGQADPGKQPPPGAIVADGERYQELASGAIYDHAVKRIVKGAKNGGTYGITQANASEYHALYAKKRLEAEIAASKGIARIVKTGSELEAWEEINYSQATLATNTNKGRASTEAARFVGQATGFLADRRQSAEPPARGARLEISPELGLAIAEMLASRQQQDPEQEQEQQQSNNRSAITE